MKGLTIFSLQSIGRNMILCFSLLYVAAIDVIGNLQSENSALCAIVDVIGKLLSKYSALCKVNFIVNLLHGYCIDKGSEYSQMNKEN